MTNPLATKFITKMDHWDKALESVKSLKLFNWLGGLLAEMTGTCSPWRVIPSTEKHLKQGSSIHGLTNDELRIYISRSPHMYHPSSSSTSQFSPAEISSAISIVATQLGLDCYALENYRKGVETVPWSFGHGAAPRFIVEQD